MSEEFSLDGAGRSIYGVSKLMADVVCQEYGDAFDIPVIVNRLGVISGPGTIRQGGPGMGGLVGGCLRVWPAAQSTFDGAENKCATFCSLTMFAA